MPKKRNLSRLYKAQRDDRERRLVALARYRAERRTLRQYAEDMGISARCAVNDQKEYIRRLVQMSNDVISAERERVLNELTALKANLRNPAIDADKKVSLALAIIDREVGIIGLNAPTKVSAEITAPQLDPVVLELKTIIFDLPAEQRQALVSRMREEAKRLRPAVTLDAEFFAEPKQLTEGTE